LIYEGDLDRWNSVDSELNVESLVGVHMVDFGHIFGKVRQSWEQPQSDQEQPLDEGYITGLNTLINLLSSIKDEDKKPTATGRNGEEADP